MLSRPKHRRQFVIHRKFREPPCLAYEEGGRKDQDPAGTFSHNCGTGAIELRRAAHSQRLNLEPSARPLVSTASRAGRCEGVAGSHTMATRESPGTASLRSSRLFADVSLIITVSPVMLPPGRARLATWPLPIGSAWLADPMGMVEVARLAAPAKMEVGA